LSIVNLLCGSLFTDVAADVLAWRTPIGFQNVVTGGEYRRGPTQVVPGIRRRQRGRGRRGRPIPGARRGEISFGGMKPLVGAECASSLSRVILRLTERGDRLDKRGQARDQHDRPE
jgi:hypothetical protein